MARSRAKRPIKTRRLSRSPSTPIPSSPGTLPTIPIDVALEILQWTLALQVRSSPNEFRQLIENLSLVCHEWHDVLVKQEWFNNTVFIAPDVSFDSVLGQLKRTQHKRIHMRAERHYKPMFLHTAATHSARWKSLTIERSSDFSAPLANIIRGGLPVLQDLSAELLQNSNEAVIAALAAQCPPLLRHLELYGLLDVPAGVESRAFRDLVTLVIDVEDGGAYAPVTSANLTTLLLNNPMLEHLELTYITEHTIEDPVPGDASPPLLMERLCQVTLRLAGCTPNGLLSRLWVPRCSRIRLDIGSGVLTTIPTTISNTAKTAPIAVRIARLMENYEDLYISCIKDEYRLEPVWVLRNTLELFASSSELEITITHTGEKHPLDFIRYLLNLHPTPSSISVDFLWHWDAQNALTLIQLTQLKRLCVHTDRDAFWAFLMSDTSQDVPEVDLDYFWLVFYVEKGKTFQASMKKYILPQIGREGTIFKKLRIRHATIVGLAHQRKTNPASAAFTKTVKAALGCDDVVCMLEKSTSGKSSLL